MSEIDNIDAGILQVLAGDGRISNALLADSVGLSPSACLRRVQALEKSGIIKGYRAVVDPQQKGIGFVAYCTVTTRAQAGASRDAFERAVARFPQVVECHNLTGAAQYLLRVETADVAEFTTFHREHLSAMPNVDQIITQIVLSTPKDSRA